MRCSDHAQNNNNVSQQNKRLDGLVTLSPPPENTDPNQASALLASEMNALSIHERENVFEDIHGVSPIIQENPEMIQNCFTQLQIEINNIDNSKKKAYNLAMSINPQYVQNNEKFCLKFLRATNFKPRTAAENIVTFMEYKQKIFGSDKLAREIQLSDLSDDDMKTLKAGWLQVLPFRDKTGRVVLLSMPEYSNYKDAESGLRSCWYLLMSLLEDEETQKRGFVVVSYAFVQTNLNVLDRDMYWLGAKAMQFLPVRFVGFHICIGGEFLMPVVSMIMLGVGKEIRARIRVHKGTHTEWQYSLLTFGIPIHHAPITYDGKLKLKNHNQWLKRRQLKEQSRDFKKYTSKIELPARNDILIGKGVPFQEYTGNVRYHMISDRYRQAFTDATPKERKRIPSTILGMIRQGEKPIRFLQRDNDGWWEETTDDKVLKKIIYRLRNKPPRSYNDNDDDDNDNNNNNDDKVNRTTGMFLSGEKEVGINFNSSYDHDFSSASSNDCDSSCFAQGAGPAKRVKTK